MVKVLLRPECDKACVSISNLGVRAAKLSAGHKLKQAENSKKRVKFVKMWLLKMYKNYPC